MKPLISIIVPIYKVEKYLSVCVEKLIHQSYENLEIILVDDGSPDRCPEICDEYQKKDNRIKVIHKKNGGLSDARNAGLDIAQGEYVAFVDSDDYVDERYIDKLYDALNQSHASTAVCGLQIVDENNKVSEQISATQNRECEIYTGREIIKKGIQGEWHLVTAWGALYDMAIFKTLRFPCGRHYEDEYTFVPIFEHQKCVVCIQENMYYYLQRSDSIMGVTYKKQDCIDYLDMWHERIAYFQEKEDRELLIPVIQSFLAWDVLYLAMNGDAMEQREKQQLKKDIRKYFQKIFEKPYLYNRKESMKLAVKCMMTLMNDKSLRKRYV